MHKRWGARSEWPAFRPAILDVRVDPVERRSSDAVVLFAGLLCAQAAAFAVAALSGNIPPAVVTLFRALLTF